MIGVRLQTSRQFWMPCIKGREFSKHSVYIQDFLQSSLCYLPVLEQHTQFILGAFTPDLALPPKLGISIKLLFSLVIYIMCVRARVYIS